ncbi:GntR family transcriptional regulator [Allokutzneria sp. A3M-2-11 16]|uniref:GntR family transcriptional regulator n=1 Tax=Allokutzneria sp. A3M-2-11 16 TaxID=2962043 RepID=UPI0020B7F8F9|nr:GntR family transcriptional regulator [Allokutzneria sp. A3M-2-11 16]MCP3799091.1 GntR family transcriptional regulator [Allokutzneria sp. A3M-2-11 16]
MKKVERRGLSGGAADRIRDAILDGTFLPGTALREVELAGTLGVSRGAVREALAQLEHEGLVQSEWHRGTRVTDVTPEVAEEVYTLRATIERLASTLAAQRATPSELAELDGVVDRMALAVESGADAAELLALDIEFHDRVYRAARHRRLREAWLALRSSVRLCQLTRIRLGRAGYRGLVVDEHRELVELLRGTAEKRLARVAEEHVLGAMTALTHDLTLPAT